MDSTSPSSARQAALAFLYGRIDYERTPPRRYGADELKLARMRRLVRLLGDPQAQYPIIHVAGTKGKGSTATMIATVLAAAGYSTGLYTSPHLHSIEERLVVDAQPCSAEELVALVDQVRPAVAMLDCEASAVGEPGPTYFEITTAMAMAHFANRRVQAAVLEVGMGGRLDSTNICQPLVSAITSISLDHTRHLGHTLGAIAGEKAGIIKPGVPIVSGVTQPEPRQVIRKVAARRGAPLCELNTDFRFAYRPADRPDGCPVIDCELPAGGVARSYRDLTVGMLGRHQGANAAVALAVLAQLPLTRWTISEQAIREGLRRAHLAARIEPVAQRPLVILDAAHNVASIEALLDTLEELPVAGRRWLVFGTTLDKDLPGMLRRLLGRFDQCVLTRYLNNPRAVEIEQLIATVASLGHTRWITADNPAMAADLVRARSGPDDLVCVTGSFFLAAEMRAELQRLPIGPLPAADAVLLPQRR